MRVQNHTEVPSNEVTMEGSSGCRVRWLIGEGFAMREFEVAPGGHTPRHMHDYEHEVFVLAGNGVVMDGDQERPLKAGDVVFVSPNDVHQFRNTGSEPMRFLCLIPNSATGKNVTVVPECGIESASK
jgi:quercetin dioxygenase-like cupin family protein